MFLYVMSSTIEVYGYIRNFWYNSKHKHKLSYQQIIDIIGDDIMFSLKRASGDWNFTPTNSIIITKKVRYKSCSALYLFVQDHHSRTYNRLLTQLNWRKQLNGIAITLKAISIKSNGFFFFSPSKQQHPLGISIACTIRGI